MNPRFLAIAFPLLACLAMTGCKAKEEASHAPAAADAMPPAAGIDEQVFGSSLGESLEPSAPEFNTETYDRIGENKFLAARQNPLSTFSIDVDTASYANVRRILNEGRLPPPDAVRIEELVNYFAYDDPPPTDERPFAVRAEVAGCPWHEGHRLVRVSLKGKEIAVDKRPASNLVFLIDVSGSMDEPKKLPLVQAGLAALVKQLTENDRVAIVVYAGSSGLVLPSTTGDQQETILAAIEQLRAGGSTNGGEGIELAYRIAEERLIPGATNRVILATDGDFNVGVTNQGDLTRLIEAKAAGGVFLSVLGFGQGNYKDSTMEKLADRGNGNYAYIDSLHEARKVLVEQMSGTLITIAKDVKIQIEFNPQLVGAYRLVGYENRLLAAEDFKDDAKDAGEIGAGHTVTALYELAPPESALAAPAVDPLKYQQSPQPPEVAQADETQPNELPAAGELMTVKLRYKAPDGSESQPLELVVTDPGLSFAAASPDLQFAAAVAGFGMLLRNSAHKGTITYDGVQEIARQNLGPDKEGRRAEFVSLVARARVFRPQ